MVITYINTIGELLAREGVSPHHLRIAPFPHFNYCIHADPESLFIMLGENEFQDVRVASFVVVADETMLSVEQKQSLYEKAWGWKYCLGVQIPQVAQMTIEQWNQAIQTAAQSTITTLFHRLHSYVNVVEAFPLHQILSLYLNRIEDHDLSQRCADLLRAGHHYDRAIREASVILEDRIRKAVLAEDSLIGAALIEHAFAPQNGCLHMSFHEPTQRGAMNLYGSIMAFFRNPAGHHVEEVYTQADALHFVLWVDFLLKLLERTIHQSGQVSESALLMGKGKGEHTQTANRNTSLQKPTGKDTVSAPKKPQPKKKMPQPDGSPKKHGQALSEKKTKTTSKKGSQMSQKQPPQFLNKETCLVHIYKDLLPKHPDGWVPVSILGTKLGKMYPQFKQQFHPSQRLPVFLKQQPDLFLTRIQGTIMEVKLQKHSL